jgi:hypothetical protein
MYQNKAIIVGVFFLTLGMFAYPGIVRAGEPVVLQLFPVAKTDLSVKLDTFGTAVNAVRIVVNFDPALVEVAALDTRASFCEQYLFVEKVIDNESGQLIVSCGKPTPGFTGSSTVFNFQARALQHQDFDMEIAPSSQVLANDGFGTNLSKLIINHHVRVSDDETWEPVEADADIEESEKASPAKAKMLDYEPYDQMARFA